MSVKVKVEMKEEYLYDFMVRHNYTSIGGIFGVLVGILGIILGVLNFQKGDIGMTVLWLFFAVYFLVVTPFSFKKKAKIQMNTPRFETPLDCEFTQEGIVVRQGEEEETTAWEFIRKAIRTKHSLILYSGRMRAFIFPKECIGEKYEDVVNIIREKMPEKKVKF